MGIVCGYRQAACREWVFPRQQTEMNRIYAISTSLPPPFIRLSFWLPEGPWAPADAGRDGLTPVEWSCWPSGTRSRGWPRLSQAAPRRLNFTGLPAARAGQYGETMRRRCCCAFATVGGRPLPASTVASAHETAPYRGDTRRGRGVAHSLFISHSSWNLNKDHGTLMKSMER